MKVLERLAVIGLLGLLVTGFCVVGVQAEVSMRFGTSQPEMTFDPARAGTEVELALIVNTYDALVMTRKLGENAGPWLAETWEVSEDGRIFTFHLRKGVLFHDGTELTAEDVVFSADRMFGLKIGTVYPLWKGLLEKGDIKAIDDYTVAFQLRDNFAPFISTLVAFGIVNKGLIMANLQPGLFGELGDYGEGYLQTHDAGSGPYNATDVIRGDRMTLRKFDKYWGGWRDNQVDVVTWLVVPEVATIAIMIKNGDLELTGKELTFQQFQDLAKSPGIVVTERPRMCTYQVTMNTTKPPLDDVNVRRAISYAFDYRTLVDEILVGSVQAIGPVPVNMPGHSSAAITYYQDLELARSYLAQSKYTPDELRQMTLKYSYVTGLDEERLTGLVLAEALQYLGIDLVVENDLWARICELGTKPETTPDFVPMYAAEKYVSPDMHTYAILHPAMNGTRYRMSWYDNPVVTGLIDQARRALGTEAQFALYGEAQRIAVDEAPAIFIANPAMRRAAAEYLQGYNFNGVNGQDLFFYNFTIERG